MRQTSRQTLILALVLLWLALTGGYAGWWNYITLSINLCLWLGLMVWLGAKGPRPGPIQWAFVVVAGVVMISAWWNKAWYAGLTQVAVLSAYMAFYALATTIPAQTINRAAVLAFLAFLPLGLFGSIWGQFNSNVVTFSLVGLAFLAWPVSWAPLAGAFLAAVWLNSLGGVLAIACGGAVLAWAGRRRLTMAAGLAAVPVVVFDWYHGGQSSLQYRVTYLAQAWRNFAISPLFGLGPGSYESGKYWHAHNIIATTAAELGLLGLVALGLFVFVVARGLPTLPAWAAALVLAFTAWSMVDEPMQFWGPGVMAMLALARGNYA